MLACFHILKFALRFGPQFSGLAKFTFPFLVIDVQCVPEKNADNTLRFVYFFHFHLHHIFAYINLYFILFFVIRFGELSCMHEQFNSYATFCLRIGKCFRQWSCCYCWPYSVMNIVLNAKCEEQRKQNADLRNGPPYIPQRVLTEHPMSTGKNSPLGNSFLLTTYSPI